jgi:hypothetical protein
LANRCYLRIPAEDPRRFGSDSGHLLIPEEAAPNSWMMPPPDSEMIAPPITE